MGYIFEIDLTEVDDETGHPVWSTEDETDEEVETDVAENRHGALTNQVEK